MRCQAQRNRGRRSGRASGPAVWIVLLFAAAAASGATAPEATWPASREGQLASGWVEAFNAGEPAMRKFFAESFAAASLATKGIDDRIATYRSLREQLGSLTLVRLLEERPGALDVALADAKGNESEFSFELEAGEEGTARKLRSITGRLAQPGHGLPH